MSDGKCVIDKLERELFRSNAKLFPSEIVSSKIFADPILYTSTYQLSTPRHTHTHSLFTQYLPTTNKQPTNNNNDLQQVLLHPRILVAQRHTLCSCTSMQKDLRESVLLPRPLRKVDCLGLRQVQRRLLGLSQGR